MQRLIYLLQRYYHLLLFFFLELLSLYAIVRFNVYHEAVLFTSASRFTGNIEQKRAEWMSYLSLKDENKRLHEAYSRLLSDSFPGSSIVFSGDTFVYRNLDTAQYFSFIPADVIRNTISLQSNYLTLNRGKKQGIRRGMGVISQQGIVGKVISVSDNFCLVMSALNKDFSISPRLAGTDYFGEYAWDGGFYRSARIENFSKYNPVKNGDVFVTTGYSLLFPANIPVGKVQKVSKTKKSDYYIIDIELSTDFSAIRSAYIVKNNYYAELDSLQERALP